MPQGNVISIVDQLRERRINSLVHRFTNASDHVEQRFALARMEFEVSQRSVDYRLPLVGGGFFISRAQFELDASHPDAPKNYTYDDYMHDSMESEA